jgi:molybdate transport system substrate-binding protein
LLEAVTGVAAEDEAMKANVIACMLLGLVMGSPALAAEVNVLSAGAIEPGLVAAADLFRAKSGHQVTIRFATAPAIRQRLGGGENPDVVLAPPAVLDELAKAGRVDAQARVNVGRVGVGVAVRHGAPVPDVSDADALKRAALEAESLVYNQASTGTYVERLFERLGLAEALKARTTRYPDGDAVMAHLLKGSGKEVGFGAITEIMLYADKGLRFVGPLPRDVQNYTSYAATVVPAAANPAAGREFVQFLQSAEAKAAFAAKGIE